MRKFVTGFLLVSVAVFAQNYGDGIWASASTTLAVRPDSIKAYIEVSGPASTTLESVLPKLKEAGIASEHLERIILTPSIVVQGVTASPGSASFTFALPVATDQVTSTLAKFMQVGRANPDLQVRAYSSAVGASPDAIREAQKSAFGALFREAKARAEQIAAEAGVSAGRVLSIVDSYGAYAYSTVLVSTQIPMTVSVRLAID